MRAGDEVQDGSKTPGCRFPDKMKAGHRRFKASGKNRGAVSDLYRILNGGAQVIAAFYVHAVPSGYEHVVDDAFGIVAQPQPNAIFPHFRASDAPPGGHCHLCQIRTLPTRASRPNRTIAEPILPTAW